MILPLRLIFYFNSEQKITIPNSLLSSNVSITSEHYSFLEYLLNLLVSDIDLIIHFVLRTLYSSEGFFHLSSGDCSFWSSSSFCYQIFPFGLSFNSKLNFERNLFASDVIFYFGEMFFHY